MYSITPILLAGGSGTRLWPSSRKTYPKQFIKLISNKTLFQQSALRFVNSDLIQFEPQITVTNSEFSFVVCEQLDSVGKDIGPILIEPEAKNTAPAIIAATIFSFKENPDAILISTPSDHIIPDTKYFNEAIIVGLEAIESGKFVTFGINPTYPETGYGYLKVEKNNFTAPMKVSKFFEKPNKTLAKKMLDEGNHFWNSGIFMFRAKDMIAAFKTHAKDILSSVTKAVDHSEKDLGFIRLQSKFWSNLEKISIDYAIMEKAKNLVAVSFASSWSDLGNWDSVWRETKKDKNGVALSENAHSIECENTLLRSEDKTQQIVGLGLKDVVAIAMPDAVLVANRDKSEDVKDIVEHLKLLNLPQSETFLKVHRHWGWFEYLSLGNGFKVKKIFIKPGGVLSSHSHDYQYQYWIVIKGIAKVVIDNKTKIAKEGQSMFFSKGSLHHLENPNKIPIIIIEVSIDTRFVEDDI